MLGRDSGRSGYVGHVSSTHLNAHIPQLKWDPPAQCGIQNKMFMNNGFNLVQGIEYSTPQLNMIGFKCSVVSEQPEVDMFSVHCSQTVV